MRSAGSSFYEVQQFRKWWFWAILMASTLGILVSYAIAFYQQILKEAPSQTDPMPDQHLILSGIASLTLIALVNALFYYARLEVKIEKYGISYRYFPLIREWRFIPKETIERWEVKSYFPTGYGIRHGLKFKTLNVTGKTGLELTLRERRNLRFGTQRPEELRKAMEQLFNRDEQ